MKTGGGVLLCLLAVTLVTTVLCSATEPDRCCFNYYPRPIHKKYVTSYFITDKRCPQPGIILTTRKLKTLCVNLNETWVQNIMDAVDRASL